MSPSDFKPAPRVKDADLLRRFRLEHAGEPCEMCERRMGAHIHHKTFRSQGGGDEDSNLLWMCLWCHSEAHGIRTF